MCIDGPNASDSDVKKGSMIIDGFRTDAIKFVLRKCTVFACSE